MKIKQYQVDAFTTKVFQGNPAAVCPLEIWLEDDMLQAIAEENNLSETAFFVPIATGFSLRWFTPSKEVNLCGHATLAAAHVIYEFMEFKDSFITFSTRSGDLYVRKQGKLLQMDFPAYNINTIDNSEVFLKALGTRPIKVFADEDYMVVFDSEATIRSIRPNFELLSLLDLRGVIVTAPGSDVDFVSRFFAPKLGIPEDPVTGSAHCMLAPYWAEKLGKNILSAKQVSKRGGNISCEVKADRVVLSGNAVTFMVADITLEA